MMGHMRIGVNLPYTDLPLPSSTLRMIDALSPEEFTFTSFIDPEDLRAIIGKYPDALYHVRPRTGLSGRSWADTYHNAGADILSFRSWPTEQNLAECLDILIAELLPTVDLYAGTAPRVVVLMGNELRLEWAPDWPSDTQVMDAATDYAVWFHRQSSIIRERYPTVGIAVAPLDEGAPDQWRLVADTLYRSSCYDVANVLADHNYFGDAEPSDVEWGNRAAALAQRIGWPASRGLVRNTETNDNGKLYEADPAERAKAYADYVTWAAWSGEYDSVSLFTLPGAPDDNSKPPWWFMTPEIIEAVADARSQFPLWDNRISGGTTPMTPDTGGNPDSPADNIVSGIHEIGPTPEQVGGQILTAAGLHQKRWQLHATLPLPEPPTYNHDFGFETNWRKPMNAWWGSPVTIGEDAYQDGTGTTYPCRVFSNAVVYYKDGACIVLD